MRAGWVLWAGLIVSGAVGAQEGSGAAGKPADAPKKAESGAREMRTLKVQGGYIRYEVLPGDDEEPPGQLFVVHEERAAAQQQGRTAARSDAASGDESAADQGGAEARTAVRRQMRRERPANAGCEDVRGKLAVRLMELRGLNGVSPELARWIQRNTFFTSDGTPSVQVFADTELINALRSDLHARGYADELARCEGDGHGPVRRDMGAELSGK